MAQIPCGCSIHLGLHLHLLPWGLGSKANELKYENHTACCAISNEVLCLQPRRLHPLPVCVKLWQANLLACRRNKNSESSQFLTGFSLKQLIFLFFKYHHGHFTGKTSFNLITVFFLMFNLSLPIF